MANADVADPQGSSERLRQIGLLRKLTHDMADATAVASGALAELRRQSLDRGPRVLDVLERSVGRLERIARRMRLWALIEEDGLMITPTDVPLDVIVERTVLEAAKLDPRQSVSIERVRGAPGAQIVVAVDHGLAVAAIGEHVANAIRFARHHVRVAERQGETHHRVTQPRSLSSSS